MLRITVGRTNSFSIIFYLSCNGTRNPYYSYHGPFCHRRSVLLYTVRRRAPMCRRTTQRLYGLVNPKLYTIMIH